VADKETTFTFAGDGGDYVDASTPVRLSLDDLRARRIQDGRHLWVVGLLYHIPDPEIALDDIVAGAHNLIGAQGLYCLWCQELYLTPDKPGPKCAM